MGSRSNSSTATTSNFYDQREVNDAAGGVIGTGNSQDNSITLIDASTTTDGGALQYAQAIGLAQTAAARALSDSAVRLASDAQAGAIDSANRSSSRAFDLASSSATQAFQSSGEALDFGRAVLAEAAGLARSAVSQAGSQASDAASTAAGAYQSAADTAAGNKTLIYVGIAAVALVGAVVAFKR